MQSGAGRLSDILAGLARPAEGVVTLGEFVDAVGERSFGALLALLAVPNMVAGIVPGLSMILGMPLVLLSLQLVVAARRPWLPRRLARIVIRRRDLGRIVARIDPRLRAMERALRPRLEFLTEPWAERLIGLGCFGLSLLVLLPIPLSNGIPSLGILCFGLALLERDGIFAIAGTGVLTACWFAYGGLVATLGVAAGHFFGT